MTAQDPDKKRGAEKFPKFVAIAPHPQHRPKPSWLKIRIAANSEAYKSSKAVIDQSRLHTVCREASCPNIYECFAAGVASFLIMGDKCTRRCPFCDVAYGHPDPLDPQEPETLRQTVEKLKLTYVVITSVDRDDLRDGGASHFARCVEALRALKDLRVEILVPDFRGRKDLAVQNLGAALPDVLSHNIETVPRLYKTVKPGALYTHSLTLLQDFKHTYPSVKTKSGLMVGIGETMDEIFGVMEDLRKHEVDLLTVGQYLPPSKSHVPVSHYYTPEEFAAIKEKALALGFLSCASGPFVRSSYLAEKYHREALKAE